MARRTLCPWSDLPDELLKGIGECLDTKTDVSRFRAVCKSWRSSIRPKHLQFPIKVEVEKDRNPSRFILTESVVHRLAPSTDGDGDDDGDAFHKRGWLVKVKQGQKGHHQALHPLSQVEAGRFSPKSLPKQFDLLPKQFDLLPFRVSELARVYSLHDHRNEEWWAMRYKVALSLNLDLFPAVMMVSEGILYHGESGVDHIEGKAIKVSVFDRVHSDYQDVVFHDGKFYVVRGDGTTLVVDSCLDVKVVSSPILADSGNDARNKKNLVESLGELLLIDRSPGHFGQHDDYEHKWLSIEVKFKVFKLDADEKQWVELDHAGMPAALDDRILLVGDDCCYSVSARDFPGCSGNSIYFSTLDRFGEIKKFAGMFSENIGVFRVDVGTHSPLAYYSSRENIFDSTPTSSTEKGKTRPEYQDLDLVLHQNKEQKTEGL